MFCVLSVVIEIAAALPLCAQARWDFEEVSRDGFDKYNVQVVLDDRGNAHMVWGSQDPNHSGLQLFYTSDATGRFVAPVLATDTGSVFDSSLAAISSFVFRLDAKGAVHLAFIANVDNQLRLFYTNNAGNEFQPSLLVADQARYDMAVDSLGVAHIVWIGSASGVISLYYWNSVTQQPMLLETLPCNAAGFGCSVGYPEVEEFNGRLSIAFRADSSSIYLTQLPSSGGEGITVIDAPRYDQFRTRIGRADLRLRMSLDSHGSIHLLAPNYTTSTRNRLLYISNSSGPFVVNSVTVDSLRGIPADFDLSTNGADRLLMTWTDTTATASKPRIAVAEFKGSRNKIWTSQSLNTKINGAITAATARGLRVSARGENVVVSGVHATSAGRQAVLFRRAALQPRIAYLHPDAAAAGMNVVVEAIAPYRDRGGFGADGFHMDSVRMELLDRADSTRVVIGPSVVSWDGRVVSTMLFVPVDAKPGAVAMALRVNGVRSNYDTFNIVVPSSGRLSGGGVIGAGQRSRRGVLVVDSLVLTDGTFTVDTTDTDWYTPGNQGLLPVTILSLGPVRIDSSATLDVSATSDVPGITPGSAGPGGGSGGSGGWVGAGSGFTGGGGFGRAFGNETLGESQGSGGTSSGRWTGGPSLNGAPGGGVYPEAAAGGGTGHPFGASGTYGRVSLDEPTAIDGGGYGAGSAGYSAFSPRGTSGGGGGGFGSAGESGNPGNEPENGGYAVGSRPLVPLSGGSGGGGGGFSDRGFVSGGSGGGALSLISYEGIHIDGAIRANGARGMNGHAANASGGGGGAGGGVLLAAKEGIVFGARSRVTAVGGAGGRGFSAIERNGGKGGDGRIRIDGGAGRSFSTVLPSPGYSGPATLSGRLISPKPGFRITGTGEPGNRIRIFVRTAGGSWSYRTPIDTVVAEDGRWGVKLPSSIGGGPITIVAMQGSTSPSRSEYAFEPEWVMSAASGNAVALPQMRHAGSIPERPCIRFDAADTILYEIENPSGIATLTVTNARITGSSRDRFRVEPSTLQVPPGGRKAFTIIFEPRAPGVYKSTWLEFDADAVDANSGRVELIACAVTPVLSTRDTLGLGSLCIDAVVDTVVLVHNIGRADLRLSSITSDQRYLTAEVIDRPLPRTIPVGGHDSVRLRLTAKGFDPDGVSLVFGSDAYDPFDSAAVLFSNGAPSLNIPGLVTFTPVDLQGGDDCSESSITIANASATTPVVLRRIVFNDSRFSVIDAPASDTTLAPLGQVVIRLRFCPGVDGEFAARLSLKFDGGTCGINREIALNGGTVLAHEVVLLTRRLQFAPVLPTRPTPPREIVIVNRGTGTATLLEPSVEVEPGTKRSEIAVSNPASGLRLGTGDTMRFEVVLTPDGIGERGARIILQTDDGTWRDTVAVWGEGTTVFGISASPDTLRFESTRVARVSSEEELVVANTGNVTETITGFAFAPGSMFECIDCASGLPIPIDPGGERRFRIVFRPESEGEAFDSFAISIASSATPLTVYLNGTGILERISAAPVDFGCVEAGRDSTIPVIVRNSGSAPLLIFERSIDNPAFSIAAMTGTDSIAAGESKEYPVTYRPAGGASSATLSFRTSLGGDDYKVGLRGVDCRNERTLTVTLPDTTTADIGSVFYLPILSGLSAPLDSDVDYALTLSFEPGLLRPLDEVDHAGDPLVAPRTDGTLSSVAGMSEEPLGIVEIRGTIRRGSMADTLVAIPMRVLLSNVTTTPVRIERLTFTSSGIRAGSLGSGLFIATDCDTSRHIVTGAGKYALSQNYPNPASTGTIIEYRVPYAERTIIKLYDETGTYLRTLVDQINEPGVIYRLSLDRTDLHSGTYYYEMTSGYTRMLRRMVVVD